MNNINTMDRILALGSAAVTISLGFLQLYFAIINQTSSNRDIHIVEHSNMASDKKKGIIKSLRRGKFYSFLSVIVIGVSGAGLIYYIITMKGEKETWQQTLAERDPTVFKGGQEYHIARAFADRKDTIEGSDLKHAILNSTNSFDMVAITAATTVERFRVEIAEALKNGVNFRFILLHPEPSVATRQSVEQFLYSIDENPNEILPEIQTTTRRIKAFTDTIKAGHQIGTISVKYYDGPILFHGWLVDRNHPDRRVGRMGFYTYGGPTYWPAVKLGRDGQPMLENMRHEFDALWIKAKDYPQ